MHVGEERKERKVEVGGEIAVSKGCGCHGWPGRGGVATWETQSTGENDYSHVRFLGDYPIGAALPSSSQWGALRARGKGESGSGGEQGWLDAGLHLVQFNGE